MARLGPLVVLVATLPVAVSCASILGIDEAKLEQSGKGGSGGSGSEPDGGGGPALPTKAVLCADYCRLALQNCTGDFDLYPSLKFCLAVCDTFPVGTRDDTSGNTVGCRRHFAESAGTIEKQFNCSAAGPGGNDVCGANCDGFCTTDAAICPEIYPDRLGCMAACRMFPVPNSGDYTDSIMSGDTVQCRLYHVNAAAALDRNQHCPHTDIKQTGPCSP